MEITIVLLSVLLVIFMLVAVAETAIKKNWRDRAFDVIKENQDLRKHNYEIISDMRIIAGDDYHNIVETTAKWKTIFELEEMSMSGSPNDKGDGILLQIPKQDGKA